MLRIVILHRLKSIRAIAKRLSIMLAAGALAPTLAYAFAEDLCFRYVDPKSKSGDVIPQAFNCWDVTCPDSAKSDLKPAACAAAGVARYIDASILKGLHGRNMLHFDTVFLYTRMLGLSEQEAFEVAAYSESTDLGNYVHTDQHGKALTHLQTDNLKGITRLNDDTPGFSYHMVPWLRLQGQATSAALRYDRHFHQHRQATPFAKTEAMINHLRLWAFGGRSTVCEFGLLKHQNDPLSECFTEEDKKTLFFSYPMYSTETGDKRTEVTIPVSWQKIALKKVDCPADKNTSCEYEKSYAEKIHGTTKSLGIYLHVLGDRLSHYYCSDKTFVTKSANKGQKDGGEVSTYSVYYDDICGTVPHMVYHYPETGHKALPKQTIKFLDFGYREIQEWMQATEYFKNHPQQKPAQAKAGFPNVNENVKIVKLIASALKQADAGERNKAMCEIALNGYGITPWHDGSTDCKYPKE